MTYPQWSYFPRNVRPPAWARAAVVEVVEKAEAKISTVADKTGLKSDDVLSELRPGLIALGYVVENGKTRADTIRRPVLFGENGKAEVNYVCMGRYGCCILLLHRATRAGGSRNRPPSSAAWAAPGVEGTDADGVAQVGQLTGDLRLERMPLT